MKRDGAEVTLVGARLENLADLLDREPELVVGREVVRPEPNAGIGTEVAEDSSLLQLGMHGRELRHAEHDRSSATSRLASARHLEAGVVREIDEELSLPE